MKEIPVKRGGDTLLLVAVALLPTVYGLFKNFQWIGLLIVTGILVFTLLALHSIRYHVDGTDLVIKSIFMQKQRVDTMKIRKIEKTTNLLASPAPSMRGRMEIYFGNDSVVISPANFDSFKNNLAAINPNSEFKS